MAWYEWVFSGVGITALGGLGAWLLRRHRRSSAAGDRPDSPELPEPPEPIATVAPDEAFLEGDLEMIRRCDTIVVTPGWENSSGSIGEIELAEKLGKTILWDGEYETNRI